MKKWFSFSNILFVAVILFFMLSRGPGMLRSFQEQGQSAPSLQGLTSIDGKELNFSGNKILIFWATWCGPCDIELARINKLVRDKNISSEQVIAISVDDNLEVIQRAQQERGYLFPIVWDQAGVFAKQFTVAGTPTIVVIDKENKVVWKTMGISPTLELRLKQYL